MSGAGGTGGKGSCADLDDEIKGCSSSSSSSGGAKEEGFGATDIRSTVGTEPSWLVMSTLHFPLRLRLIALC